MPLDNLLCRLWASDGAFRWLRGGPIFSVFLSANLFCCRNVKSGFSLPCMIIKQSREISVTWLRMMAISPFEMGGKSPTGRGTSACQGRGTKIRALPCLSWGVGLIYYSRSTFLIACQTK